MRCGNMGKLFLMAPIAIVLGVNGGKVPTEYFHGDVEGELQRADREGKRVVVSLGREICGRCQKFYKLLAEDKLVLDPAKCIYLKLDVDELEQREYFYAWFDPEDRRLPYVGVLDPNARTGVCVSAGCDLVQLKKLLGDLSVVPAGGDSCR